MSISVERENFWKPNLQQESHQRDKHLDSSLCKILGISHEIDEERTSLNEPEDKKTNDDAQSLTSER